MEAGGSNPLQDPVSRGGAEGGDGDTRGIVGNGEGGQGDVKGTGGGHRTDTSGSDLCVSCVPPHPPTTTAASHVNPAAQTDAMTSDDFDIVIEAMLEAPYKKEEVRRGGGCHLKGVWGSPGGCWRRLKRVGVV